MPLVKGIIGKLKSIQNHDPIAAKNILSIVKDRPLDINIETTNFCPLACAFCPNTEFKRKKESMDSGLFRKICEDFYHLGGGAVGISSMQSDIFSDVLLVERIKELKNWKDRFWIHSTTTLLGAKKFSDEELALLLGTFDYLEISLGGIDKDSYFEMVRVKGFDLFKEQLYRVRSIIDRNNFSIDCAISFRTNNAKKVLHSELYKEISGMFRIHDIKDKFFSWGGIISQSDLPQGAKLDVVNNERKRTDCVIPWSNLSVNVDGTVVGCGCVDWNARHKVGNLKSQSIGEVWNSPLAKQFRTAFSTNTIPELCKSCSLYVSVDMGFGRKSLRDYKPTDGLYYTR